MIEADLDNNWRPHVNDPVDKIIEHGGFAKHPEKLAPAEAILKKSEEWLQMMGYFQASSISSAAHGGGGVSL